MSAQTAGTDTKFDLWAELAQAPPEPATPREARKELLGHRVILAALCGVPFDRYDAWRDSMSDEFFYMLVEKVSEEDFVKILLRTH